MSAAERVAIFIDGASFARITYEGLGIRVDFKRLLAALSGERILTHAIYYLGDFPAYGLITKANADNAWAQPIYVGKAIPAGARKGLQIAATEGTPLASRIREHRRSVIAADNLDIEHFWVRWLVVEPFWIPLGESLLINRYAPVWYALVEGFGNHDAGSGRHAGKRTMWDVLHPGRKNIEKYADRPQTAEHIIHDVMEYLRARIDP